MFCPTTLPELLPLRIKADSDDTQLRLTALEVAAGIVAFVERYLLSTWVADSPDAVHPFANFNRSRLCEFETVDHKKICLRDCEGAAMSWPYGVVSLVVRGQRVYVVHESSDQSKPILFRDHWPTIHTVHELPNEWDTRYKSLESQGGGSGAYTFWYEGNAFGNCMSIVLMFRGQTESIKRDVLEILPPTTKQETRYQDGRWQRYLKSDKRGWIDCHPWQVAQPLERVGPAIHPIGERIKFEKTDVCLVYRDTLAKEPNQVARLMYDNLNLQIAKGFSEQVVEYIKKDAAQYGKGDLIEIRDRNMQVILGMSLK